ncbi:MAG: hypothetical protein ACOYEG_10380, partial [Petrimonas sp.]
IAGSFASATPPLHCPLFIVISIIMNKFATKKDRNYTLFGTLPANRTQTIIKPSEFSDKEVQTVLYYTDI